MEGEEPVPKKRQTKAARNYQEGSVNLSDRPFPQLDYHTRPRNSSPSRKASPSRSLLQEFRTTKPAVCFEESEERELPVRVKDILKDLRKNFKDNTIPMELKVHHFCFSWEPYFLLILIAFA